MAQNSAISDSIKTTSETRIQQFKEAEDFERMDAIMEGAQSKLLEVRVQASEARAETSRAELRDKEAEIADPPTKQVQKGSGKNMKMVTMVDEKALAKLKDEAAQIKQELNTAELNTREYQQQAAEHLAQSDVHASNSSAAKDSRTSAIAEGKSQLAALRNGEDFSSNKNDDISIKFNKDGNLNVKVDGQDLEIDVSKLGDKSLDETLTTLISEAEEGLGSEVSGGDFASSNIEQTRDDNINVA